MTYNIISIDGGPAGLLPVMAMAEIEKECPGFLARADMFAGTSSGAMTSLLLAKEDDPAPQLAKAAYLWNNPNQLDHNTTLGYIAFILGMGAMNSTSNMKEFLARPDLLGDVRLSQLKKKVVAVSYRVSPTINDVKSLIDGIWRSKVFNNFGGPDDPDYHEKAVDVAVASGSAPLFAPVYRGNVDGGVTANNPTMCALVQIHRETALRRELLTKSLQNNDLRNARVLSLGGGRRQEPVIKPFANWGYGQWLLNPTNPLLVVNALLQGGTDAVNFQSKTLLAANGFFRLDPRYVTTSVFSEPHGSPKGQAACMNLQTTKDLVQRAIRWIKECGWMDTTPEPTLEDVTMAAAQRSASSSAEAAELARYASSIDVHSAVDNAVDDLEDEEPEPVHAGRAPAKKAKKASSKRVPVR